MARFLASQIGSAFWEDPQVRSALAGRNIAALFETILARYPDANMTRLGTLIDSDRAEVSKLVRGRRSCQVYNIEVLERIADGLEMPDSARMTMGLAPAEAKLSQVSNQANPGSSNESRLAVSLCGSRNGGTQGPVVDAVVPGLAKLILSEGWAITHGPVGVGMEVMVYLADRYRPNEAGAAVGTLGHRNVVSGADFVLVVGGGRGTATELDLAAALGKRVLPLPCAGGASADFIASARHTRALSWLSDNNIAALRDCGPEGYPRLVQQLIAADEGASA